MFRPRQRGKGKAKTERGGVSGSDGCRVYKACSLWDVTDEMQHSHQEEKDEQPDWGEHWGVVAAIASDASLRPVDAACQTRLTCELTSPSHSQNVQELRDGAPCHNRSI